MSTASISYSSLRNASNEATAVAKKLDNYADSLYNNVYKKLNNYGGGWTSNMANAMSGTNAKISELRSEQSRYETYASDLINLKDECQAVDRAVKSKVSSLTATFKEAHGIRNSVVENVINYIFTSVCNATSIGRWISDKFDQFDATMDYLKSSIKEWFNFEGGKEFLKGASIALLEIAIALCTIISGGGILVMIAACIGLASGIVNLVNEIYGYGQTNIGNDPASGRRISKVDSIQDLLRTSDDRNLHLAAAGIDFVNLICGISAVVSGVGSLLKNGYKWATGNMDDIAKVDWKKFFSKKTFQQLTGKFTRGFKELQVGLKLGGWDFAKKMALDYQSNFLESLKHYFIGDGSKSIKNGLSAAKSILSDGLNFKTILTNIVFPGMLLHKTSTLDIKSDGQYSLETDFVTMGDFYDIYDDIKSKIVGNDFWKNGLNTSNGLVMDKLSQITSINICIPEIYLPKIEMPILRTV